MNPEHRGQAQQSIDRQQHFFLVTSFGEPIVISRATREAQNAQALCLGELPSFRDRRKRAQGGSAESRSSFGLEPLGREKQGTRRKGLARRSLWMPVILHDWTSCPKLDSKAMSR